MSTARELMLAADQLLARIDAADESEWPDLSEILGIVAEDIDAKTTAYVYAIERADAQASRWRAEAAVLTAEAKRHAAIAARLRGGLAALIETGLAVRGQDSGSIRVHGRALWLQRTRRVEITGEVPPEYMVTTIPAPVRRPDAAAIRAALESGWSVQGAMLVETVTPRVMAAGGGE